MISINYGVDAKILQYESYAKEICIDKIDFMNCLAFLFSKKVDSNFIIVNLERHKERYKNTLQELYKLGITNFYHLKGTEGKNREAVKRDLVYILDFLKQFNNAIDLNISIDAFSVVSDENIHIQEGPLGCYCSHVRAMIHGYLNFQDYTIICEDDISITNTKNIESYLKLIPKDWDVICMNAAVKNVVYTEPYYKFTNEFHSTHFYIINHKCFPYLFSKLYPITDQVDVLISNLYNDLNIYNIEDTVYQKNIETNTQNNLHVIFNSPHYWTIRQSISSIKRLLLSIINKRTPGLRNEIIIDNLMYDVLFDYITRTKSNEAAETYEYNVMNEPLYQELLKHTMHFINASKKGIDIEDRSKSIIQVMLFIINSFELGLEPYGYGSSANTYKFGNMIHKKYHNKLRFNHNESLDSLFNKELIMLMMMDNATLDSWRTIVMPYYGESLYNDFNLPKDWKDQIIQIFEKLNNKNIFYPEFWLQNILVLDGKITFIDYGLASFSEQSNKDNCQLFINNLEQLNEKLSNVKDRQKRYQLIHTYFINKCHQ